MADTLKSDYATLMKNSQEPPILQCAESISGWDMETMMPPKAIKLRSEQFSLLSTIEHKMSTDPEIGSSLAKIASHKDYAKLTEEQKRNIYLIKKRYDEQTKLPEQLVAAIAKQQALTIDIWKKAKAAKRYAMFQPELEQLFDLEKKAAEILKDVKKTNTSYDALIDIYEPKITPADITNILYTL